MMRAMIGQHRSGGNKKRGENVRRSQKKNQKLNETDLEKGEFVSVGEELFSVKRCVTIRY